MLDNERYKRLIEDIIDYQAALAKALLNYNYEQIAKYSNLIGMLIRKILKDNKMNVEK